MTDVEKYYNEQIKTFAAQPFHQLKQNQVNYLKTSFNFVFWKWKKTISELSREVKQRFSLKASRIRF